MISVFTPTHNPRFITQVYETLVNQTFQNWEWIIYMNGQALHDEDSLVDKFNHDNRVYVLHADSSEPQPIGKVKGYCVSQCSGDVVVELDHDDLLLPTALEEVDKAHRENPNVGFFYSNFAQMNEDGTPNNDRFGDEWGWADKYYQDQGFLVCRTMIDHPHNFSQIYYQPNHLRAFTKKAYSEAGGYSDLDILDDQDLMCRLYLVAPFHHIDKLLYLQRVYDGNSQKIPELRKKIPQRNLDLYAKYISEMSRVWADRNNLLAIDLGAGHRPQPGFIGVDLNNAQIIADVTKGMPFGDNKVGVIRAVDFLEHIPDKIAIINEIYRVLVHGGMLLSMTPSTDGAGAFSDPTHVAYYNERSFWYYTRQNQRRFTPEVVAKFQESYLTTHDTSQIYGEGVKHVVANLIAIKEEKRDFGGRLYL